MLRHDGMDWQPHSRSVSVGVAVPNGLREMLWQKQSISTLAGTCLTRDSFPKFEGGNVTNLLIKFGTFVLDQIGNVDPCGRPKVTFRI